MVAVDHNCNCKCNIQTSEHLNIKRSSGILRGGCFDSRLVRTLLELIINLVAWTDFLQLFFPFIFKSDFKHFEVVYCQLYYSGGLISFPIALSDFIKFGSQILAPFILCRGVLQLFLFQFPNLTNLNILKSYIGAFIIVSYLSMNQRISRNRKCNSQLYDFLGTFLELGEDYIC